jgi:NitT/TauT family transport system substrate-binding protein
MSGWSALAAGLVGLSLLLSGCASRVPSGQSLQPATVKVGLIGIIPDSALHIANQRGYFQEQNLTLDITTFTTGGEMVAPLATGELQVGFGAISAALFNAMQRDIPIKIISDAGHLPPGAGTTFFAIRKQLVDSGQFKDVADLKGRKVALVAHGSGTHIALTRILDRANLSAGDIETPLMPFPDMLAAFRNESIDAAVIVEPLATIAALQGLAVKWKPIGDFYPNQQIGVSLYSGHFAKDSEVGKRFMVAYMRGVRDYTDAFFKNKGKEDAIKIMVETGPVKDPAMFDRIAPEVFNPDGYVNVDSVVADYEWYVANGFVKQQIDPRSVIDNQFVSYALEKLGRYR